MKNHFVNLVNQDSDAKGIIYNQFDYNFDNELYDKLNDDIPIIYDEVYKYILSLSKDCRPIVFSPDYAISSATLTAISEKYMVNESTKYTSPVQIIYLTPICHMNDLTHLSQTNFAKCVLTNAFGENCELYTKHRFIPCPENVTLLGLNDITLSDEDTEKLKSNDILHFTLSQIRKKGLVNIIDCILNKVQNDPVHFIFDMSVMSAIFAPSVFRFIEKDKAEKQLDGLSVEEAIKLFEKLCGLNIVGLDIMGYCLKQTTSEKALKETVYCAQLPLIHLLKIKSKKINIFTEYTKFLIFRPVEQNDENEVGWYILKGVSLELEEKMIERLELMDDMEIFDFGDGNLVYISITSVSEQNEKCYYSATTVQDRVLMPEEKQTMHFYLLAKQPSDKNEKEDEKIQKHKVPYHRTKKVHK